MARIPDAPKEYNDSSENDFRRSLGGSLEELEAKVDFILSGRDGDLAKIIRRTSILSPPVGVYGPEEVLPGTGTVTSVATGIGLTGGPITSTGTVAATGTLADVFGLTPLDGKFIVGDGANFVAESGSTARTSMGCGTGDGTVTGVTGGDGVTSTGGAAPAISLDLKANGGAVIESAELAVDLGASSITGQLANSDLANDSVTVGSTEIDLGATAASISGLTHASGSISSGVTAATQAVMNESTEVATTAYVDRVALGPAYGSFSKSWGPGTGRNPTITKGAGTTGNFFPQETSWTENITSVLWEENEDGGGTRLGTFSYTGDYPDSGSRKFVAHWGINLWYYVAASYVALAGRIMKTPSGGSEALVPGSLQVTSWDHYLLYLGYYYYIKHVSGTAMFEISSASDTIQFDYGVNSTYGSGTTTLIAYQAYGSGATLNIQALD